MLVFSLRQVLKINKYFLFYLINNNVYDYFQKNHTYSVIINRVKRIGKITQKMGDRIEKITKSIHKILLVLFVVLLVSLLSIYYLSLLSTRAL